MGRPNPDSNGGRMTLARSMSVQPNDTQADTSGGSVEKKLLNKVLSHLIIYIVGLLPIVMSLSILVSIIIKYFDVYLGLSDILNDFFGCGFLVIGALFVFSYTYRFCGWNRVFLYYIIVNKLLAMYDTYIGIDTSDIRLFQIYLIIFALFMLVALCLYLRNGIRK